MNETLKESLLRLVDISAIDSRVVAAYAMGVSSAMDRVTNITSLPDEFEDGLFDETNELMHWMLDLLLKEGQ